MYDLRDMIPFRYIVNDVNEAVKFYRDRLGFVLSEQFGPAMAIMTKGDLQLWLAGPMASASKPLPGGRKPTPGGYNRIVIVVNHLENEVGKMRSEGAAFLGDVIDGPGGKQIVCEDPSGNLVELFEPA